MNDYDDLNDVHCIILFIGQCQSVSAVHTERNCRARHRPCPGPTHLAGGREWDGYRVHQEVIIWVMIDSCFMMTVNQWNDSMYLLPREVVAGNVKYSMNILCIFGLFISRW